MFAGFSISDFASHSCGETKRRYRQLTIIKLKSEERNFARNLKSSGSQTFFEILMQPDENKRDEDDRYASNNRPLSRNTNSLAILSLYYDRKLYIN